MAMLIALVALAVLAVLLGGMAFFATVVVNLAQLGVVGWALGRLAG